LQNGCIRMFYKMQGRKAILHNKYKIINNQTGVAVLDIYLEDTQNGGMHADCRQTHTQDVFNLQGGLYLNRFIPLLVF
jgi:hypothetical protein